MDGLLFLVHRLPYPPNKGDKIRSFHLLRHLSQRYRVHLGAFVDDADDWQFQDQLLPYCAEIKLLPLHPRRSKLKSLRGLFSAEPLSLPYYRNAELLHWAQSLADRGVVSRGLAFSSAMAQFMPRGLARRVMDMVDVDSDKWTQYAATQASPLSWLYAREGRTLAAWERRVACDFDATLLVSNAEARLLQQRVPDAADKISAFENGVDAGYFSPVGAYANPCAAGVKSIVFTGAMDYWPNIDAVVWFAETIFPQLKRAYPEAQFSIVGSRPAQAVRELARQSGVVVTGSVPDVRPYLAHAVCAVAPLRIARGVQNKVLEAMAMARPVVATREAAEGIHAEAGKEFDLAPDAAAFIAAVSRHLAAPDDTMGRAARLGILRYYDWERNLSAIDRVLQSDVATTIKKNLLSATDLLTAHHA
jgi:sugar transferase (PEP-CTERM/EpsH1 system associated)